MIVDLFAGPGGWDHALETWPHMHDQLVGYEHDRWACATRAAAGHRTIRADVGAYDLARLMGYDIEGLIGSPPCPTFSQAGDGSGRGELDQLIEAAHAGRMLYDTADPRSALVLEPARWARWLRPRWVALEQVPPALPVWEATAHYLRTLGYATWCGVLNAADYGVPQTRRRAILLASLDRQPRRPPSTHEERPVGLFALTPWASVRDALPWLTPGHVIATGMNTMSTSRNPEDMVPYERSVDRPAPTLDGKAQRWSIGPPGHRTPPMRWKVQQPTRTGNGLASAYRPSVADLLALQSFPRLYRLRGTRAARGRQVGDAMPPQLARHVLAAVTGSTIPPTHAPGEPAP